MPYPLGYPLGRPHDPELQRAVLAAALDLAAQATLPGEMRSFEPPAAP